MELEGLKILYVCHDFPFPPMNGGLVDMWNRIRAFHRFGAQVDVIATVKEFPNTEDLRTVQNQVRNLRIIKRKSFLSALLRWKPLLVAVREELGLLQIDEEYDLLVMQTEFVTEILKNRTATWQKSIIRVENDEYSFQIKAARAQRSLVRKLIYFWEAIRIKSHAIASFQDADMLWFISHDDLMGYKKRTQSDVHISAVFMPSAVDLTVRNRPSLNGQQVLFVGNLSSVFNKAAVEWYILNIHPRLADIEGYKFVVAGSSLGKDCHWLESLASHHSNIDVVIDADDLSSFYNESALFVNPMQSGAGVKLKTIEAGVRGLPILSTPVGAEGTGLIQNEHFILAHDAGEFCSGVRKLLGDKALAAGMVERCQMFLLENYDQKNVLKRALDSL
jgi:glycosyltransferase involved in cell wall biosynthesis